MKRGFFAGGGIKRRRKGKNPAAKSSERDFQKFTGFQINFDVERTLCVKDFKFAKTHYVPHTSTVFAFFADVLKSKVL